MRLIIALFFITTSVFSFAQYSFTIKGKTPAFFNNKKIYLCVWDDKSPGGRKIDSTTINADYFSFTGSIDKPSNRAVLYTKQIRGNYNFVIDTGLNALIVNEVTLKSPFAKNKLSTTEVVNSASNKIYSQIENLTNGYYLTKGKPSPKNKNVIELNESDRTEVRGKIVMILKQHPNTFYSLVHLDESCLSFPTTELLETYNSFNNEIKTSVLGLAFNERLLMRQEAEMGRPVKAFTALTNTDSVFSSASLNGKAYLLAFGATWCMPCKERLPLLKQLHQKFGSKGLEIVYVNLDEMTQKWKSQVIKEKMEWINISENVKWKESKISKAFNVTAIPFYLVVDKAGKIVYNETQLNDDELKLLEKHIEAAL